MAACKVLRLHTLIKLDLKPEGTTTFDCNLCSIDPFEDDLEHLSSIKISDSQDLIASKSISKEKFVYIAGYLTYKNKKVMDANELIESEYLDELSRGRLRIPTLEMFFFVHSAYHLYEKIDKNRLLCTKYFRKILQYINCNYSSDEKLCSSLTNIIFKADVLNSSDRESQLGCLRRKEKLSSKK